MPAYWEPGETEGLGIPLTMLQTLAPRMRMQRIAQTAYGQGATIEQAREYAIRTEQARPAGVTTVRSRIIGGVQTMEQPRGTGGSVFGRRAKRVIQRATRPRVSEITSAVPPGRECPPGQYRMPAGSRSQYAGQCMPSPIGYKPSTVSLVNGVKVPTAIINGIRNAEARPTAPPPGELQQPPDTYAGAIFREGLEKLFGRRQMDMVTPEAPPGTMPKVADAGLFEPDAMQKMLPIAAAGIGAWLLFRML